LALALKVQALALKVQALALAVNVLALALASSVITSYNLEVDKSQPTNIVIHSILILTP
jgi:hypothetical protein